MDAEIRLRIEIESVLVSVCVFSTTWNTQVEEDDLCFSACSARYLHLLSSQHPVNYSFKLWRCRWNIHDRIHYGSWMKIQFHDAVIYNIFPISEIHSIIFITTERQVLIITDVIVYSERGVVVNYCGSYSFKQALTTPSSQHI